MSRFKPLHLFFKSPILLSPHPSLNRLTWQISKDMSSPILWSLWFRFLKTSRLTHHLFKNSRHLDTTIEEKWSIGTFHSLMRRKEPPLLINQKVLIWLESKETAAFDILFVKNNHPIIWKRGVFQGSIQK